MDGAKTIRVKDGLVTSTPVLVATSGGSTLIYGYRAVDLSSTVATPTDPHIETFDIELEEDSTFYINSVFSYRLKSTNTASSTRGLRLSHRARRGGTVRESSLIAGQDNLYFGSPATPLQLPYVVNNFDVVTFSAGTVTIEVRLYEKFDNGYLNTQVIVGENTLHSTMPIVFES